MKSEAKFNVLKDLQIKIRENDNPFNFKMEDLFEVGARINPKRSFLFISKLLGKHIEVNPEVPKVAGHLLANVFNKHENGTYFSDILTLVNSVKNVDHEQQKKRVEEELNKTTSLSEPILFVGFAETATGLGHAVASAFSNSYYVHTTREEFKNKKSIFDFQEEHSHATGHLCYLEDEGILNNISHIVLIDDEITTGKTCLNLINALNDIYPGKRYTVLTLLDWRAENHEKDYENFYLQHGLSVSVLSLLRGDIEVLKDFKFEDTDEVKEYKEMKIDKKCISKGCKDHVSVMLPNDIYFSNKLLHTGRFGLTSEQTMEIEPMAKEIGTSLIEYRNGKKTLCIGSGEFIYLPSRIASYMGDNVFFKSSTRSPIYVDETYVIKDRISYKTDEDVINYIYNIGSSDFDEVFMFFEELPSERLRNTISNAFASKGIKFVRFITL